MKIVKINYSKPNAYSSIKSSMSNKSKLTICNSLDACGCTGNGQC